MDLSWGDYETSWLLQEYLSEFYQLNQSELPANNMPARGTKLRHVALSHENVRFGGANIQVFHDYVLIDVLWVRPAHRKKGFGRQLADEIEKYAKSTGAKRILLSVFEHQASLDFWKKFGCEEVGRIRDYPPGQQLIYLHKRIC
jgi:ribosomal protein S18 acetylase RimI-like enzyme